jgi:RNA exonuclease 4
MGDPADPHIAVPRQSSARAHVAIDCEMVQIVGGKQVLAHVCAVDWNEAVLLNTYVAPGARVKDYLTRYSGLRPGDLDGAPTFDSVRAQVAALLEGSILVGHAPSNDLRALQCKHPVELTRDTAALDWGEQERGLGSLCREVLGVDIQAGTHSPLEDAIASLRLLKYHQAHGAPPLRMWPSCSASARPRRGRRAFRAPWRPWRPVRRPVRRGQWRARSITRAAGRCV